MKFKEDLFQHDMSGTFTAGLLISQIRGKVVIFSSSSVGSAHMTFQSLPRKKNSLLTVLF